MRRELAARSTLLLRRHADAWRIDVLQNTIVAPADVRSGADLMPATAA